MINQELFNKEYEHMHVADLVFVINKMVAHFLVEEEHNQYYITNITSNLVYQTYDIVKYLDETDVTVKIGYVYTIRVLKNMFHKFGPHSFLKAEALILEYRHNLDEELNKSKQD